MQGFSLFRTLTSSVRWLMTWGLIFTQHGVVLASPPFFQKQVVLRRGPLKATTLRIQSYFDWATVHEIFVRREYDTGFFQHERSIQEEYQSILETGGTPLILDLGANIGIASVFLAQKYPDARVFGIEADEANAKRATSNTSKSQHIEIIHSAIAPEDGQIPIFDPGLGNNAYRTFGSEKEFLRHIPAVSIDTLLENHSDLVPFFLKVDIEGFESSLFEQNVDWIDRFKVIAIETHDWMLPGKAISSNLLRALGGRNRDLVFRGENLFSIRND